MENPLDLLNFYKTMKPADDATIRQFMGILPDFLLDDWRNRGFASYLKGLLMTTNPNDFYDVLEGWVDEPEKCHVVYRTAFGSFLYLKDGTYYNRSVIHNLISNFYHDLSVIIEFSLTRKDTQKDSLHNDIYKKALKRLGPPAYDEVYAFVPVISMGGDYNPDTIQKVKLKEHLAFLEQVKGNDINLSLK